MKLFTVDFKNRRLISQAVVETNKVETVRPSHITSKPIDSYNSDDNLTINTLVPKLKEEILKRYIRLKERFSGPMAIEQINCDKPVSRYKNSWAVDCYADGDVHCSIHSKQYVNREKFKRFNRPMPFPAHIDELERVFKTPKSTIKLGVNSDSFMWLEKTYRITLYFLVKLIETNYKGQLKIYTRSDLIACDEYIDLLKHLNVKVIMYIPAHNNDDLARIEEPGAPSIKRRHIAIDKLKEHGIKVVVKKTHALIKTDKSA